MEYTKSAANVLLGSKTNTDISSGESSLLSCMEAANQVAGCGYEYGTSWGKEVILPISYIYIYILEFIFFPAT